MYKPLRNTREARRRRLAYLPEHSFLSWLHLVFVSSSRNRPVGEKTQFELGKEAGLKNCGRSVGVLKRVDCEHHPDTTSCSEMLTGCPL